MFLGQRATNGGQLTTTSVGCEDKYECWYNIQSRLHIMVAKLMFDSSYGQCLVGMGKIHDKMSQYSV